MSIQYTLLSTSGDSTLTLSDEASTFRFRVSGDSLLVEKMSGATWTEIEEIALPGTNKESFRLGARSSNWNIDQAITTLGFSGTEDTDWSNIEQHSL